MPITPNVDGLAVASPVQVNGYKVGQGARDTYDYADPGKIKVMLAMDKKLSIPRRLLRGDGPDHAERRLHQS